MKTIYNSSNDKKDIVKAGTTPNALKDLVGNEITIKNIVLFEDTKEDETVVKVCAVELEDGWYNTTSPSIIDTIDMIVEGYTADDIHEGIPARVQSGKSSKGREYFTIALL